MSAKNAHATLPLAIVRGLKVKPKDGDKPACIDLALRIPVDGDAAAAIGFLLDVQGGATPVQIDARLCRKPDAAALAAAVRRP